MTFLCCSSGQPKGDFEPQPRPARLSTQQDAVTTNLHVIPPAAQKPSMQKIAVASRAPVDCASHSRPSTSVEIDLWYEAYVSCYSDDRGELLDELGQLLARQPLSEETAKSKAHSKDKFRALNEALASSLPAKVKAVEDLKWPMPLTNGKLDVVDAVEKVIEVMVMVKDFVGAALTANPTASLVWSGVCFGIQLVKNPIQGQHELLEAFHAITNIIHRYLAIEQLPQIKNTGSTLRNGVVELYSRILVFQAEALRHLTRRTVGQLWSNMFDPTHWSDALNDIKAQTMICEGMMTQESLRYLVQNARDIAEFRNEVVTRFEEQRKISQAIRKLMLELADEGLLNTVLDSRRVEKASYKADKRRCLAGTRSSILTDISIWSASDNPVKQIFWVTGMAGTGKSTIAATIGEHSANWQGHIVASFFFSRNEANRRDTDRLVPTLAMQLANSSLLLKNYICKAIRKDRDIFTQNADEQWTSLIQEPLQELEKTNKGAFTAPAVFLIIDGLDECEREVLGQVVAILSKLHKVPSLRFRALITSRLDIEDELDMLKPALEKRNLSSARDVSSDETDRDIRNYYKHRLVAIREKHCRKAEPRQAHEEKFRLSAWPTDDVVERLVQKSGGVFQYANVACNIAEYAPKGTPNNAPDAKIRSILKSGIAEGLDDLYATVLSEVAPKITPSESDHAVFFRNFRIILGSILFSLEPLSCNDVANMLKTDHEFEVRNNTELDKPEDNWEVRVVRQFVYELRSLFRLPEKDDEAITSFHLSLGDLLGDEERCRKAGVLEFHIRATDIQEWMFRSCAKVLETWTPQDYNVDQILMRIYLEESYEDKSVPSEVRYACLFWTAHYDAAASKHSSQTAERTTALMTEAAGYAERLSHVWIAILCFLCEPEAARKSAAFLENMLDHLDISMDADRLRRLESIPRVVFENLAY